MPHLQNNGQWLVLPGSLSCQGDPRDSESSVVTPARSLPSQSILWLYEMLISICLGFFFFQFFTCSHFPPHLLSHFHLRPAARAAQHELHWGELAGEGTGSCFLALALLYIFAETPSERGMCRQGTRSHFQLEQSWLGGVRGANEGYFPWDSVPAFHPWR